MISSYFDPIERLRYLEEVQAEAAKLSQELIQEHANLRNRMDAHAENTSILNNEIADLRLSLSRYPKAKAALKKYDESFNDDN